MFTEATFTCSTEPFPVAAGAVAAAAPEERVSSMLPSPPTRVTTETFLARVTSNPVSVVVHLLTRSLAARSDAIVLDLLVKGCFHATTFSRV